MNFNSESKRTQLASATFAKNTAGQHDRLAMQTPGFAREELQRQTMPKWTCSVLYIWTSCFKNAIY